MDSSAGSLGRGHNRLPELWSVSVIVSCLMIEAAFIHSLRQSVRHSAHFHLCSGKLTLMFAPETSMRYGGGRAHREIDRWRDGWMDVEMDSCENTAAAPPREGKTRFRPRRSLARSSHGRTGRRRRSLSSRARDSCCLRRVGKQIRQREIKALPWTPLPSEL